MSHKSARPRATRALAAVVAACAALAAGPTASAADDPAAVQKRLDKAAADYAKLETELAHTEARMAKLESDLAQADRIIASKAQLVRKRAGYMYKRGGAAPLLEKLLLSPDLNGFVKRLVYVEMLDKNDSRLVEGLRVTKSRADQLREDLQAAERAQMSVLEDLKAKKLELQAQFRTAQGSAKVKRFGNFASFTLPVSPSGFANTWGAPRSGGRRHKGTDVMAACGAPVVAVTAGTVSDLHSGGNGGTMLYLRTPNSDVFFYAHLRKYAPGIHSGSAVKAGQLVAYNGNTGNARGGPCHVHFEWHPRGGRAVNPYPLLAAIR